MGSGARGAPPLTAIARVVPDVPSFAVDDGFAYAVPEGLDVDVGAVVRIPLGGRRVRGWVVARGGPTRPGLRAILARSGDVPVFDPALLGVLRWAAMHYVAPLSTLLAKATPPNLARGAPAPPVPRGSHRRSRLVVGLGPWHDVAAAAVAPVLEEGRSAMVMAPTVVEARAAGVALSHRLGREVAVVTSEHGAAATTAAWLNLATVPGTVIVGTREIAAWPMAAPGVAVVLGEGRRGLKDKATPTVHARDLLLQRAAAQRFAVVLTEVVPTAEALERSAVEVAGRPWGLVDLVDRSAEAPGAGLVAPETAAALRAAGGRRVLLFTHRRTGAQRCVRCRVLRRCPRCGAAPGDSASCPRCGADTSSCANCGGRRFEALGAAVGRIVAEVGRIVGREKVGLVGSGAQFAVGTERDLPGLEVDLTVVLDGDGPLLAPSYRASEDALRMLGRAVAAAGVGRGRRGMVQTVDPQHPVLRALSAADPVAAVRVDAARRAALGFPPGGEVLALEAVGELDDAEPQRVLEGRAEVHGPAAAGKGRRWLVQGRNLDAARVVLRDLVGRWRESGVRVRVDADPIDL